MPVPKDIRVIDTLLDLPREDRRVTERFANLRDAASLGASKTPAAHLFKETPEGRSPQSGDPVGDTLREMDKYGIETAVFNLSGLACTDVEMAAIRHPSKRFRPVLQVDPNRGMDAVRDMTRAHDELGIVGIAVFPVGY